MMSRVSVSSKGQGTDKSFSLGIGRTRHCPLSVFECKTRLNVLSTRALWNLLPASFEVALFH